MKLRIGLDCSSACVLGGTGIAAYVRNLVGELAKAPPLEEYVVCWRLSRHRRRYRLTRELPSHVRRGVFLSPLRPLSGGKLHVFHGLDVRVPPWRRTPLVSTVHDVFSLVSDEFAAEKFRKKKIKQYQRTAERATAILCDSRSTAEDLHRALDVPWDKLVVVPLGVEAGYRPEAGFHIDAVREHHPIPELYILFVGRFARRKNVARLVRAFELAAPSLPAELHLVLVGGGGFGSEEAMAALERSPLRHRILHIPYLSQHLLQPVYACAGGFAFPTLYEGFGLPILEALASGCPALTGNVGASPETGGDAVLTVDPTSEDAIAAGLVRLMTDETWRRTAIQRGLDRARQFTWGRTAVATRTVYHRIAAGEAPKARQG